MNWTDGEIDGVILGPIGRFSDSRGWLSELFRSDEIDSVVMPRMGYVSLTYPGVSRGPHEHVEQSDMFAFLGPGNFELRCWDHRPESPTLGNTLLIVVGVDNPMAVIVPPCVVHGYTNVSDVDGLVMNFPNRLYAGQGKSEAVDEIRHEDDPAGLFSMGD